MPAYSNSSSSPADANEPVFDVADPVEIVRLSEENWLFTTTMGGPLADVPEKDALEQILDIACGPGDWILDVAFNHANIEVTGVDFNPTIIAYANAKAQTQRIQNASFGVMNWTSGLDFSDETFDLVNGRLLELLTMRQDWPGLLQEAYRVLRPGGSLRLIYFDSLWGSTPAFDELHGFYLCALYKTGLGLSPTGRSLGISPKMPRLVRQAGFHELSIHNYSIDFSSDSECWSCIYRNLELTSNSLMPLVVNLGLQSQEKVDKLYQQALLEMMSGDFCGVWPFFCLTARKPYLP